MWIPILFGLFFLNFEAINQPAFAAAFQANETNCSLDIESKYWEEFSPGECPSGEELIENPYLELLFKEHAFICLALPETGNDAHLTKICHGFGPVSVVMTLASWKSRLMVGSGMIQLVIFYFAFYANNRQRNLVVSIDIALQVLSFVYGSTEGSLYKEEKPVSGSNSATSIRVPLSPEQRLKAIDFIMQSRDAIKEGRARYQLIGANCIDFVNDVFHTTTGEHLGLYLWYGNYDLYIPDTKKFLISSLLYGGALAGQVLAHPMGTVGMIVLVAYQAYRVAYHFTN